MFLALIFRLLSQYHLGNTLFPLNGIGTLDKNQLAVNVLIDFKTLSCIPLVLMAILILVPHCFDFYTFVVSFKISPLWLNVFLDIYSFRY